MTDLVKIRYLNSEVTWDTVIVAMHSLARATSVHTLDFSQLCLQLPCSTCLMHAQTIVGTAQHPSRVLVTLEHSDFFGRERYQQRLVKHSAHEVDWVSEYLA